jgi:ATP-dependent helicase HrpB
VKQDLISTLPVHRLSPEIVRVAGQLPPGGCLVLKAEPGSGKTTWVPSLLSRSEVWGNGLILVTEPRRLAAVGAAHFAAHLLDEQVGQSIGYAVRGEQNVSAKTRVQYVTEGLALQMLADPSVLSKLVCIILDEFHERHAPLDVILMLLRRWQAEAPSDLIPPRIVLMSATFDQARWDALFLCQRFIDVPGQIFPVDIVHKFMAQAPGSRLWAAQVAAVVCETLIDPLVTPPQSHDEPVPKFGRGVLVFLPGKGEIRRVRSELETQLQSRRSFVADVVIEELHGERTLDAMRQAIDRPAVRKIFLSTNIAESSLTLKGVRVVVDTGIARVAVYHVKTCSTELILEKIAQQSAIQRAGRAGREAPGKVVRLYSEDDFLRRPLSGIPEISTADCAREILDMFRVAQALGHPIRPESDVLLALPWLDPPHKERLLAQLGQIAAGSLVDRLGALTPSGTQVARLPLPLGLGLAAAEALSSDSEWWLEITAVCLILAEGLAERLPEACGLETVSRAYVDVKFALMGRGSPTLPAVQRIVQTLRSLAGNQNAVLRDIDQCPVEVLGACFFVGSAARVAHCLQPGWLVHCSGEVFEAPGIDEIGGFFLILDSVRLRLAQPGAPMKRVTCAVPVSTLQLLEDPLGTYVQELTRILAVPVSAQDARVARLQCVAETRYGELVLDTLNLPADGPAFRLALKNWISDRVVADLQRSEVLDRLRVRLGVLPDAVKNLGIVGQCLSDLESPSCEVLERLVGYVVSSSQQSSLSVIWDPAALLSADALPQWMFPYELLELLRDAVPESLQLVNGKQIAVEYSSDGIFLVGRIQEFFGVKAHPLIGKHRLLPRVRLLAPNGQTAQITADLGLFWEKSYADVRKAYAGRYPKHYWPTEPAQAHPYLTNRQARGTALPAASNGFAGGSKVTRAPRKG